MIYWLLYELIYFHFREKDWYVIKALNVFQYVTFRTAYATITALLISLFFGGKLIDALKEWNVGQQIREEGPQGHQVKRGTPTMGGVLIVGSVLISTLFWARLSSVYVWTAMGATLTFAAIGFIDDYSKMAKQRSLGLTGRQKLLAQLLIAVGLWAVLFTATKFIGGTGYSWNLLVLTSTWV
jgi:phospho-N-acetylmuramoyl-pentapeptide-transferase